MAGMANPLTAKEICDIYQPLTSLESFIEYLLLVREQCNAMHDESFMEEDMLLELAQVFKACNGDFREFVEYCLGSPGPGLPDPKFRMPGDVKRRVEFLPL
jgi:hypothetical protein